MYHTIMVPLDGSELAECVLPHVEAFIKGFNCSDVVLVRVLEPDKNITQIEGFVDLRNTVLEYEAKRASLAQQYLDSICDRLTQGTTAVHAEVLAGQVTESLTEFADKRGVELIIIATHGRSGITRWIMGSVAEKLLRSAKVPVLMVQAPGAKGRM